MSRNKSYKNTVKDMRESEIVKSMLISESEQISEKEHKEFLKRRVDLMNSRTKEELIVSNLLQFKYEVETYIELGIYDSRYSFSKCLKRYMNILNKSSKDITEELTIHKTRLSRILNAREEANSTLSYKLEKHSGKLLPAIFWWKLIALKKDYEIRTNKKERKDASRKVKSIISAKGKVYG